MEKINEENKRNGWEMVKDIAKVSAFATLLAFTNPTGVSGKDKKINDFRDSVRQTEIAKGMRDSVADYKTVTEDIRQQVLKRQAGLRNIINEYGKQTNFNGQKVIEFTTKNGDVIILGNNDFDGKTWMSLTTPNKLTYLDSNGDGLPDSALINLEDNFGNDKEKFDEDLLNTFLDLDQLSVMTGTYNKLTNKKRFNFQKENNGYVIEALDMNTGKKTGLEGSKADEVMMNVSRYYSSHLDSIN